MMSCDNSLSSSESKVLAKKLRDDDPEQFQTLVKMHLSFVLDLTTEDDCSNSEKSKFRPLKWGFSQFQKKPRGGNNKTTIDGLPLSKEGLCQLQHLINFLSIEENVIQEGIFRRSGKVTRQQELKSLLSQGLNINLAESQFSVHDVATVLKSYLAELPEPLVTENHYPAYCQVADYCRKELGTKSRVLRALQLLLLLLPYPNRRLLKNILKLLHLIASHVDKNKMSPQNLATLFTPHLLVPRKLTPEVFHTAAQSLSCIVVFMINHGHEVFDVPQALATDIKAYWDRRRKAPNYLLERSISEGTAAKTVFSFVDRERTAQENVVNPTETALAQLYAHIQSLPESNKKKRLIKQFNKENGQGTPRTRSIGDSIKKHIFNKHIKGKVLSDISHLKYEGYKDVCSGSLLQDEIKSPESPPILKKVGVKLNFNDVEEGSVDKEEEGVSDVDVEVSPLEDLSDACTKLTPDNRGNSSPHEVFFTPQAPKEWRVSSPRKEGSSSSSSQPSAFLLTSTPACGSCLLTPSPMLATSDDMSPITRSTQRMPKAMQEAMITPRSRKPVVALSGSNLCHLGTNSWVTKDLSWGNPEENKTKLVSYTESEEGLTSPFRDYLFSRSVVTGSPVDLSFSSRTGDFDPSSSSLEGKELSESLLYFLDGGSPPSSNHSSGSLRSKRERQEDDPHQSKRPLIGDDDRHLTITETSL